MGRSRAIAATRRVRSRLCVHRWLRPSGQGLHAFENCCIGQGELGALLEHAAHCDHPGPLFDGSDECRHGPLAAF
jgi:hypothetical protein